MKGSNKQFTRFLESEYNDDYLEPLENNNQINLDTISKPKSNHPQQKSNKIPNPFPPESKLKNTNLKKSMVQDLVSQLGEDPRQCLEYLQSIQPIKPTSLEAYEALCSKFLTIPALFLSVTPEQTVYLWQINQRCPFRKGNQLLTDSSSMSSETCPQISFLLLAKITSLANEQILGAGILRDNLLYVRSRTGDNELTIKFYNVEKFRNIARINPYKQEVLANEYYSYKIVIKKFKEENDKSLNTIDISLWKKNAEGKDELLQTKICEGLPTVDTGDGLEFNDIHCGNDGVVLVLDRETAIVIGWRNDELVVLKNKERNISSEHHYYEVSMHNFPNIEIQDSEILASNLVYYRKLDEWRDSFERARKTLEEFRSPRHTQSLTSCLSVYDVPWLLINPHLMNMNTNNDHLEEEKERSIVEKIEKKKNELKYAKSEQNSVQEKNELLKEIRADISSKIKEGIKFNEEYEAEQQKRYPKKIEEPEGVSKEALKLYSEIKAEKKKMTKNREKEKIDRKKDRLEKKEF